MSRIDTLFWTFLGLGEIRGYAITNSSLVFLLMYTNMVTYIPNTYIFCRWTHRVFKIVSERAGCSRYNLENVATKEEIEVTSDALGWNYVTRIPQELLQPQ